MSHHKVTAHNNHTGDFVSKPIILGTLSVFVLLTATGNFLLCVACLFSRQLKHRSNIFFASLAGTNFLYALIVMTFNIVYNSVDTVLFPDYVLILFQMVDSLFCTASISHLVAIALDRFMNILTPLTYAQRFSIKAYAGVISILWFSSALAAFLPTNFGCQKSQSKLPDILYSDLTNSSRESICFHHEQPVCAISQAVLSFLIPLLFMFVIYARMFMITRRHLKQIKSNKLPGDYLVPQAPIQIKIDTVDSLPRSSCPSSPRLSRTSLQSAIDPLTLDSSRLPDYLTDSQSLSAFNVNYTNSNRQKRSGSGFDISYLPYSKSTTNFSSLRYTRVRNSVTTPSRYIPKDKKIAKRPSADSRTSRISNMAAFFRKPPGTYADHKAVLSLALIFGSFLVCWLPYFLINCVAAFNQCVRSEVMFAATWLGYSNSCLNPIVYALLNSRFRRSFVRMLRDLPKPCEQSGQYGLARLRFTSDATIRLALGRISYEPKMIGKQKQSNTGNKQ